MDKTCEKKPDWRLVRDPAIGKDVRVSVLYAPRSAPLYRVLHGGKERFFGHSHEAYTYCAEHGMFNFFGARKKRLFDFFRAQNRPYGADIIDGESVVYRREERFDVEISQGRNHPFSVYIWSLNENGVHQQIVRQYTVQSRDIPSAAQEIDLLVKKYMSEECDEV